MKLYNIAYIVHDVAVFLKTTHENRKMLEGKIIAVPSPRQYMGGGGSGSPLMFRPLLKLAQIHCKDFYMKGISHVIFTAHKKSVLPRDPLPTHTHFFNKLFGGAGDASAISALSIVPFITNLFLVHKSAVGLVMDF